MEVITDTKTGREYRFEGDCIGRASTHESGRARWSEIEVWRTPAENYVVVKFGRSDLVHLDKKCASKYAVELTGDASIDRVSVEPYVPCPKCTAHVPSRELRSQPVIYDENDLVTVVVCEDADSVVRAMHHSSNGVVHLTHLASEALAQASEEDESIARAFNVAVVP